MSCPLPDLMCITLDRRRFHGLMLALGAATMTGCGGSSSDGSAGSSLAPSIDVQPASAAAAVGDTVSLEVAASGDGLRYQWLRDDVEIPGARSARLVLTMQAADDGAAFAVRIENASGSVVSRVITLTLLPPAAGIGLIAGRLGGSGLLEAAASDARLELPVSVASGPGGALYVLANEAIWQIDESGAASILTSAYGGGEIRVDANGGVIWLSGSRLARLEGAAGDWQWRSLAVDDAAARLDPGPQLFALSRLTLDAAGRVHLFTSERTIVRLDDDGRLEVLAGHPANGFRDGVGQGAGFGGNVLMTALNDDRLLVVDGDRVRTVDPQGVVQTLPDSLPYGLPLVPQGEAVPFGEIVADGSDGAFAVAGHAIVRIGLDGRFARLAGAEHEAGFADGAGALARFHRPQSIDVNSSGMVVVADRDNHVIRRVDPGTGASATAVAAAASAAIVDGTGAAARFEQVAAACGDREGNYHLVERRGERLRTVAPDGRVTTRFAQFPVDGGVAVDADGNFYGVRDRSIVRIAPDGAESLLAGRAGVTGFADGRGADATFANPQSICVDTDGALLVLDAPRRERTPGVVQVEAIFDFIYGNTVRRVGMDGQVTTLLGEPGGRIEHVVIDWTDPGTIGLDQQREWVRMACGPSGDIYIAESRLQRVQRFSRDGAEVDRWQVGPIAERWILPAPYDGGGLAVLADGRAYVVRVSDNALLQLRPGGVVAPVVGSETSDGRPTVGVRLGSLPASLNRVSGLTAVATGSLICSSENAVLRIGVG
ncbi:MAG: hypothetical protein KDH15_07550 [Rhodocyclaceae bacterium]|nr:hypothetical protein [Rhodocyclaceae bacterium]